MRRVLGQKSWVISSGRLRAAVTRQGGHLGPVYFRIGKKWVQPFDVAPWATEKFEKSLPQVLRVMRGDFFCMPFGGSDVMYRGEKYPPHGETANGVWKLESSSRGEIHLSMTTKIRKGRVDKFIRLADEEGVIYQRHVVSGMKGLMCFGHHPILRVPAGMTGRVSTSAFRFGQVCPDAFEDPAEGGYWALKQGAKFKSLERVPLASGGWTSLSEYPAREGFEDLVLLATKTTEAFSWTALVVPEAGYIWFSLKNPRVLASTLFWMSNGGRHYYPWNGRHRRAIGLEEVTATLSGLADSARDNVFSRAGVKTCVELSPRTPLVVSFIMGMAEVPVGFDRVKRIEAAKGGVRIVSDSGVTVGMELDLAFLESKN